MPSYYKTKIIAVGSSHPIKSSFFQNCEYIFNSPDNRSSYTIGVSINVAKCLTENDNELTMSIWDINSSDRFHTLYPAFFRGARGCLLFYNVSNENSFNNLRYWINLIRENTDDIPIILVGNKYDSNEEEIYKKINDFIENNNLECFFLTSGLTKIKKKKILTQLAKKILESLGSKISFIKLTEKLKGKEKKLYDKFFDFFLVCPICKRKNHQSHLRKFFFSRNPDVIKLREKLLELIENPKNFGKFYHWNMKLGIPCCSCYRQIYSE